MSPFARNFPKGKIVFYEGDHSQDIYIIKSGQIGIYRSGKVGEKRIHITTLGKGSLFGEMAMIDGKSRSASAEVIEDTELHVISVDEFEKVLSKVPGWYMSIIKVLTSRIREADKRLKLSIEYDHTANVSQLLGMIHKREDKKSTEDKIEGIDLKFAKKEIMQVLSVDHPTLNDSFTVLEKKDIIRIEDNRVKTDDVDDLFMFSDYLRSGKVNISSVRNISPLALKVLQSISNYIKDNDLKGKLVNIPLNSLGKEANEMFSKGDFLSELSELKIIDFSEEDLEKITPETGGDLQIDPIRLKDLIASLKFGD